MGLLFPYVQYGELHLKKIYFGLKTCESYPYKGQYFQINLRGKKYFFLNVFFYNYIILKENQILNKTYFWYFFIF